MDKLELRKQMRSRIIEIRTGGAEWASFSYSACERILAQPEYSSSKTIMCYCATKHELDVSAVVRTAQTDRKSVVFPVCVNESGMLAYEPLSDDAWEHGAFSILSPIVEKSHFVAKEQIDLILVPGLAFDEYGGRLGRGAGFFDRYLKNARAFKIGICADAQIVEHVPTELHDIRMDMLITEKRCIRIENA